MVTLFNLRGLRTKGVIITSGLERDVFTAGNDINELYAPNTTLKRYKLFWKNSNTFLANLIRSPLVTVAAIRGQCPAGGTLIWMYGGRSDGCMQVACCLCAAITD